MLFDWFTVIAQVLNFLILVWLMKRFLYKPILHAIDARELRIAKELADAETKMTEAQNEREEFHQKNRQFDQERSTLLKNATDEVQNQREKLLSEARQAAEALSAKLAENLKREEDKLFQAISLRTQEEVFGITRKVLMDLATASLEESMVTIFISRLKEISEKSKSILKQAINETVPPGILRSTYDLSKAQQAEIQNTINETFAADLQLQFETSPKIISGIELSVNGQKLSWSISDYLNSLEASVSKILAEKGKRETKTETKHEAPILEGKQ